MTQEQIEAVRVALRSLASTAASTWTADLAEHSLDAIDHLTKANEELRAEGERLTPYVDAFRREERRADDLAQRDDEARATIDRLTKERDEAIGTLRWAHETLYEINPSNYDHDEVCKLNDASVEVILGIAPLLGEKHGKTDAWWHSRIENQRTRISTMQEAIDEVMAENARLRENAKANNALARHEAAGRKAAVFRAAELGNALEALIEAAERGDVSATDLADCRALLRKGGPEPRAALKGNADA